MPVGIHDANPEVIVLNHTEPRSGGAYALYQFWLVRIQKGLTLPPGPKLKKRKIVTNRNRDASEVSIRTLEATESVRSLILSLNLPFKEKIAMEDQINNLSHESDCLLGIMSYNKTCYKKK